MEDKEHVIRAVAKELFSLKGFKATGVAEIMKKSQMAVGTFYNYFDSKEDLFMTLYLEENRQLKETILSGIDRKAPPFVVMETMMKMNYEGMLENPILREWYNRELFHKMEKSFIEKQGLESVDFMYTGFLEVVKFWQETGVMRSDIEADMIMALFGSIVQVELHKVDIGEKYFPELLGHLSTFVMNGLMATTEKE